MTEHAYDDPYYVPRETGRGATVSRDGVSPGPFPSSPSPTLPLDVSRFPSPEGFPSDGRVGAEDDGGAGAEGKAGEGNESWLPGDWTVEPVGPAPAPRRGRQGVPVVAQAREGIFGSGLAAEFRDPRPSSLKAHGVYISTHKNRPDGIPGIAFAVGYGAATFPFKIAGKVMTHGGTAVAETGRRLDRAGDRFVFVAVPFAFFIVLVIIFLAFS